MRWLGLRSSVLHQNNVCLSNINTNQTITQAQVKHEWDLIKIKFQYDSCWFNIKVMTSCRIILLEHFCAVMPLRQEITRVSMKISTGVNSQNWKITLLTSNKYWTKVVSDNLPCASLWSSNLTCLCAAAHLKVSCGGNRAGKLIVYHRKMSQRIIHPRIVSAASTGHAVLLRAILLKRFLIFLN